MNERWSWRSSCVIFGEFIADDGGADELRGLRRSMAFSRGGGEVKICWMRRRL